MTLEHGCLDSLHDFPKFDYIYGYNIDIVLLMKIIARHKCKVITV